MAIEKRAEVDFTPKTYQDQRRLALILNFLKNRSTPISIGLALELKEIVLNLYKRAPVA